jgi:hypothetical protein
MPQDEVQDLLVRFARLESKIDSILETIKNIPILDGRIRNIEIKYERLDEKICSAEGEIKSLRATDKFMNWLNGIGVILAGILAGLGLTR